MTMSKAMVRSPFRELLVCMKDTTASLTFEEHMFIVLTKNRPGFTEDNQTANLLTTQGFFILFFYYDVLRRAPVTN